MKIAARLFVVLSCIVQLGCTLVAQPSEKTDAYLLSDPKSSAKSVEGTPRSGVLLIQGITAPAYIDSEKIYFAENEQTRGHYQYAQWIESPAARFLTIATDRLVSTNLFRGVTHQTAATSPDYALYLELSELYQNLAGSSNEVHMTLTAELTDLRRHELVGRQTFQEVIPVSEENAQAAVSGASTATGNILDGLVAWLDKVIS